MKNNSKGQANPDKSGSKSNQKTTTQVNPKKETSPTSQPLKKGKQNSDVLDPEELEEGTTMEEDTDETSEEKKENKTGKRGNL